MRLTGVILSAVLAASCPYLVAAEDANLTYTVYAAESAWLGLTTDDRMKIQLYQVPFRFYQLFIYNILTNATSLCS